MAYVKTTWQTGDVITAEKLNNMEGGIEANDQKIVIFDADFYTTGGGDEYVQIDLTADELSAYINAGKILMIRVIPENGRNSSPAYSILTPNGNNTDGFFRLYYRPNDSEMIGLTPYETVPAGSDFTVGKFGGMTYSAD